MQRYARAWHNGEWIRSEDLRVSVHDVGFVQGVTVTERLRTFAGRLFSLEEHLQRLRRSLQIVGLDQTVDLTSLGSVAAELAAANHALLQPAEDLALIIFVTPGTGGPESRPTTAVHTQPLDFAQMLAWHSEGQVLRETPIRQVPPDCWPPELKCRSRMHYYLADRLARQADPRARAILLDHQDRVIEASTANVVAVREKTLTSPPRERILPGVSVGRLTQLAEDVGWAFEERDLSLRDLERADEVLLCSTSPCVWSVSRVNETPLPGPRGNAYRSLIDAWSAHVGLDIVAQARQCSSS